MRDMDQYMLALDIIAKVNHIDEYLEEQQRTINLVNNYQIHKATINNEDVDEGLSDNYLE